MWASGHLIQCMYSYTYPVTSSTNTLASGIGCGGINSLWILSIIVWLSCSALAAIWLQLSRSMTCIPGVYCCHAIPPMDFLRRPNYIYCFDGGGKLGVVGWFCWHLSIFIACCNNGFCWLLFCTLDRFAYFWGNWDMCGAWVTTFGCWTCSLPCCVSGGWFFSSGGHYFANIDASLYNSSDVSLLLQMLPSD